MKHKCGHMLLYSVAVIFFSAFWIIARFIISPVRRFFKVCKGPEFYNQYKTDDFFLKCSYATLRDTYRETEDEICQQKAILKKHENRWHEDPYLSKDIVLDYL